MKLAKRVEALPPYLFAEISRKVAEKRAQGVDVISFAIGDPDLPTPEHILESLREASRAGLVLVFIPTSIRAVLGYFSAPCSKYTVASSWSPIS